MNDNQKIQLKLEVLSQRVKETFGNHRNLANEIQKLFEQNKVSKVVSDSTIYRMLTKEKAQFKARDVRTVAEALGCSFESLTDIKKPGFRTVELVKQSSGQNVYEEVSKADLIDFQLVDEPAEENAQKELLNLVQLIEQLHSERRSELTTISLKLKDQLAIRQHLDRGSEHFSIFIGVARRLLPCQVKFDEYEHRLANNDPWTKQQIARKVFTNEDIRHFGCGEAEEFEMNRGGVDFAKILFIRCVKPDLNVLSEQVEIDPYDHSLDCSFDRENFVEVENIAREIIEDAHYEPIEDLKELENLELEEIVASGIRKAEKGRRNKDVDTLK